MPIRRKPRRKPRRSKLSKPTHIVPRKPRMAPRVLQFKRKFVQDLVLNTASAPIGWTSLSAAGDEALVLNYVISMAQIPNYTAFTSLFDSYRIKGVRIQGYYSFNVTTPGSQAQAMLYYCRDHMGQSVAAQLSEDWFLERPRSRKRLLVNSTGRPSFDIYMPLTQLANTYQSVTNNDYTMKRPRFISTNEVNTPHYGLNLRIQRIDGNTFTANTSNQYPTLKLFTTVYWECRGINS